MTFPVYFIFKITKIIKWGYYSCIIDKLFEIENSTRFAEVINDYIKKQVSKYLTLWYLTNNWVDVVGSSYKIMYLLINNCYGNTHTVTCYWWTKLKVCTREAFKFSNIHCRISRISSRTVSDWDPHKFFFLVWIHVSLVQHA